MIASKERQHGRRVTKLKKFSTRILPVAAIFGANASGKSNLFDSIKFAKNMVMDPLKPDRLIPVESFKLTSSGIRQPTRFNFELLVNKYIFEFSFAVTKEKVVEEKLVRINSSSEEVLFHRIDEQLNFAESLRDSLLLEFVFRSTRNNQLFLTNSVHLNINEFKPVYDWFKNNIQLISPDTQFRTHGLSFDKDHLPLKEANQILSELDTGISRLGFEEIPFDRFSIHSALEQKLKAELKEGKSVRFPFGDDDNYLVLTRKDDSLIVNKLISYHQNFEGEEVMFEMHEESDGTQRALDLLPAFIDLINQRSAVVYIFDEIDRSLHTMLIRCLLEYFLVSCNSESRSQLLFTTHDLLLMDQDLFRRDEMWLTERDQYGCSDLFSFGDFKDIRYDKDIRKDYLQGRYGGIPSVSRFIG